MEQLSLKDELRELIIELKAYFEIKYDIARLNVVEATAIVATVVLMSLIIFILVFASVLFLSFGLAFYLADIWKSNVLGFLAVGGGYLIFTILLYTLRNVLIRKPILKNLIMLILPSDSNGDSVVEEETLP